jgi:hypothetical protein
MLFSILSGLGTPTFNCLCYDGACHQDNVRQMLIFCQGDCFIFFIHNLPIEEFPTFVLMLRLYRCSANQHRLYPFLQNTSCPNLDLHTRSHFEILFLHFEFPTIVCTDGTAQTLKDVPCLLTSLSVNLFQDTPLLESFVYSVMSPTNKKPKLFPSPFCFQWMQDI